MNYTDVIVTWADGEITTESFKSQSEFFRYKKAMEQDGFGIEDFCSSNVDWSF